MTHVFVIVEGYTEKTFIEQVLAPELWAFDVFVEARLIGKPGHKGGHVNYARLKSDVRLLIQQHLHRRDVHVTTFFDYYGIGPGFPGRDAIDKQSSAERKKVALERAIREDINTTLGDRYDLSRFFPYVQMHEFEGLLFSEPECLARTLDPLGHMDLAPKFSAIRESCPTPEDINENPSTAPSKRIAALVKRYEKDDDGNLAALEISLTKIRASCPLFNAWVTRLEQLGSLPQAPHPA